MLVHTVSVSVSMFRVRDVHCEDVSIDGVADQAVVIGVVWSCMADASRTKGSGHLGIQLPQLLLVVVQYRLLREWTVLACSVNLDSGAVR